jgi:hypothetical protein
MKTCCVVTEANLKMFIKQKARAKCEMRSECLGSDAEEVIEIMKASMVDCHENELSSIDGFSESQSGSRASSKSGQIKRLVGMLVALQKREGRKLFQLSELKELISQTDLNMKGMSTMDVIHMLNTNNFLLNKGGGNYELSV